MHFSGHGTNNKKGNKWQNRIGVRNATPLSSNANVFSLGTQGNNDKSSFLDQNIIFWLSCQVDKELLKILVEIDPYPLLQTGNYDRTALQILYNPINTKNIAIWCLKLSIGNRSNFEQWKTIMMKYVSQLKTTASMDQKDQIKQIIDKKNRHMIK